ncbi:hypothetical protein PPERSA_03051 [Pseudocohnilembus persalinus]|uniref:RING-type E3 ubiquitin transferase n=1 Tax=Pseudocohnilembus persalinus TaxID=266149 RepID=A0A0V0Q785_PSEPJ|nr:hypothetical protein PPERSA_03051 [Pseudocohnilembus persalinus]|eukprot:KRW98092.1 hypothetical protein PPERSA_03051 [Pseudocohnilembus persalinus]
MEQNKDNFDSIFKVRKPIQYKNEDQIDLIGLNVLDNEEKQQIIINAICDKKILSKLQFENIFQLLKCPICLEIFNDPYYVKACSHRFCKTCIEDFVRKDKSKECPLCRSHIGIKRNLRQDAQVQELCAIIFGNVSDFNKQLNDLESSFIDKNWNDIRVKESETVQKQKRSYNKLQKTVSDTIMTNQEDQGRLVTFEYCTSSIYSQINQTTV